VGDSDSAPEDLIERTLPALVLALVFAFLSVGRDDDRCETCDGCSANPLPGWMTGRPYEQPTQSSGLLPQSVEGPLSVMVPFP
jgi:hypothetical protein